MDQKKNLWVVVWEALVAPYGFERQKTAKIGPYNYLITFVKS